MESIIKKFSEIYNFKILKKKKKDNESESIKKKEKKDEKKNNEEKEEKKEEKDNLVDIVINREIYCGYVFENDESNKIDQKLLLNIRGPNIVRINKICEEVFRYKNYILFIMDKALLKDFKLFSEKFHCKDSNMFKTINNPFTEKMGDNLLRFFVIQIVNGMELLERRELVHFEIKPENILIYPKFKVKLSDFKYLTNLNKEISIPKFHGYVSPETYNYTSKEFLKEHKIPKIVKKQDYFSLGATIFFLKYGEQFLKYYYPNDEINLTENDIIDLIQKDLSYLNSQKFTNNKLVDFITSLIEFKPEDRPTFEEIYRNKWLNTYQNEINFLNNIYIINEENKLLLELMKSDYLIKNKEVISKKKKSNFTFKK